LLSCQTTQSKVVGSREALEWFQFVTVNGEVEFEDEGRVAISAKTPLTVDFPEPGSPVMQSTGTETIGAWI